MTTWCEKNIRPRCCVLRPGFSTGRVAADSNNFRRMEDTLVDSPLTPKPMPQSWLCYFHDPADGDRWTVHRWIRTSSLGSSSSPCPQHPAEVKCPPVSCNIINHSQLCRLSQVFLPSLYSHILAQENLISIYGRPFSCCVHVKLSV